MKTDNNLFLSIWKLIFRVSGYFPEKPLQGWDYFLLKTKQRKKSNASIKILFLKLTQFPIIGKCLISLREVQVVCKICLGFLLGKEGSGENHDGTLSEGLSSMALLFYAEYKAATDALPGI